MTIPSYISIELLSDTTFGSSAKGTEIVDVEISHDSLGLPTISGKTLRGLLRESWIVMREQFPELDNAFSRVLGRIRDLNEDCILRIGDAQVDDDVRNWIAASMKKSDGLTPEYILSLLTDIRVQTSVDRMSMSSEKGSLRYIRVALRGLKLYASINWLESPSEEDLQALAMCLLATRHAGLSRSRGRGHIRMLLNDDLELTKKLARLGGGK